MLDAIKEDIQILITRMFRADGEIFMFGEDGFGKHGRSDQIFRGQVVMFDLFLSADDDEYPSDIECLLRIYIDGYNAASTGHGITDGNLEICLDSHFKRESIDPDCWDWADISMQGPTHIALTINTAKLLGW